MDTGGETGVGCGGGVGGDDGLLGPRLAPAAQEIVDLADEFAAVWAVRNEVDNEPEVVSMLSTRARTLHLGTANYCWFIDPAKALCLRLAGIPDADRPLAGMCDSARCLQATHHPCHRPVWEESRETAKVFIGSLSRRQTERARLEVSVTRAERVLAEIDQATTAGTAGKDEI